MPSQSDILRQMMDEANILADIRKAHRVPTSLSGREMQAPDHLARRDFEAFIREYESEIANQAKRDPEGVNEWLRYQVSQAYPPDHPLREMPPRFTPAKPQPISKTKVCPECGREHYSTNDYPGGGHFCGGDVCGHLPRRTDRPGFSAVMLEPGERVLSSDEVRELAGVKPLRGDALKHAESTKVELKKPRKPGWFRRMWADVRAAR